MQSHDAEFADHGRTPKAPTIQDWAAQERGAFTSDQLDAEWRRLADEGDIKVKSLEAKWQKKLEELELCIAELRNLAHESLTKRHCTPPEM